MNFTPPLVFGAFIAALSGAANAETAPATADLEFLLGDWEVVRTYQPGVDAERDHEGSLNCEAAVEGQFIKCVYHFERRDKPAIHDEVFFNYNPIYGVYESVWLSATWSIKTTMSSTPEQDSATMVWNSEFPIEDGVTEWVRSEWTIAAEGEFSRRLFIRTSRDPEAEWTHWMDEHSTRK